MSETIFNISIHKIRHEIFTTSQGTYKAVFLVKNKANHKGKTSTDFKNKRSVLRRQSRDTNRNIKRWVYCQSES